jgi:hypothetical protein
MLSNKLSLTGDYPMKKSICIYLILMVIFGLSSKAAFAYQIEGPGYFFNHGGEFQDWNWNSGTGSLPGTKNVYGGDGISPIGFRIVPKAGEISSGMVPLVFNYRETGYLSAPSRELLGLGGPLTSTFNYHFSLNSNPGLNFFESVMLNESGNIDRSGSISIPVEIGKYYEAQCWAWTQTVYDPYFLSGVPPFLPFAYGLTTHAHLDVNMAVAIPEPAPIFLLGPGLIVLWRFRKGKGMGHPVSI